MSAWIDLPNGHRAYRAAPASGAAPRVLMLHAWWGLNDAFRQMADRLASEGFTVVAPDLYGGVVAETPEDAEREVNRIPLPERMGAVEAALAYLLDDTTSSAGGVAAVGFSLGAFYALEVAAREPALRSAVLFYGTGQSHDWSHSQASFLGHFAGDDPFEPADHVASYFGDIRRAGRSADLHVYPAAGHWFMEPDRPAYDGEASALAWDRTVAFLKRTLVPASTP